MELVKQCAWEVQGREKCYLADVSSEGTWLGQWPWRLDRILSGDNEVPGRKREGRKKQSCIKSQLKAQEVEK